MDTISKLTFRRFLLGQQGLWPGRRFKGLNGVDAALRQIGVLQLDPLNIVARSQEIAMYGRVLDFKPEHIYQVAYEKRRAFDYGGWLAMYPMDELPYWRTYMNRRMEFGRWGTDFARKNEALMKEVRDALKKRGPLGNRDFTGNALKEWSYRGRKETSLILYYLWLTGELMISHRKGFDRYYDLRERVAPPEFHHVASEKEAEDFFARKTIEIPNIMREKRFAVDWRYAIGRVITKKEAEDKLNEMYEKKVITSLQLEGSKEKWIMLSKDLPVLETLESGRIPKAWKPLKTTTEEEVTLFAPLEMVSARGRAKVVFDFQYTWEVYVPAPKRRWGYYVLPILYGDDLVARLDPKLDRKTNTLHILGFWLEDDAPKDEAFASALAKGLKRFKDMIGADKIDVSGIAHTKIRSYLKKNLK
ncbi:MAG: YcaQ family DNA glycosylase [Anaerolineales bacterium]|nr:YcaQ family DNA glycosylase [Anaerolineales bacterium]